MSSTHIEPARCPKCRNIQEFTVWDSINTETENAISYIMSGKLFEFKCKKCGYTTNIQYPMLFNDMDNSIWIYLVSPNDVEDVRQQLDAMPLFGVTTYIVQSIEELKQKIVDIYLK